MTWQNIHGHDTIVEHFRRAMARGRLASSFLFAGPEGVGKRTFASKLAQAFLCQMRSEAELDPCGECPGCTQVLADTHPDVQVVEKPQDKSFIPLELLIGDKDHRGREGLCHNLSMKPFMGGRRIAIIDDADFLNAEGANSLLKTLEEPPPRSVLILIGTSPAKQLPTIRSRCQLIRFQPLATETVERLLIEQGLAADEATRLAGHSEGSLGRARRRSEPELWEFRDALFGRLAEPMLDSVRLAKTVLAFVDEAGKQPAARRRRLGEVVALATEFYRGLFRAQTAGIQPEDAELGRFLATAMSHATLDHERTAAALERCLDAAEQIGRNANPTTLIETWLDDLARR